MTEAEINALFNELSATMKQFKLSVDDLSYTINAQNKNLDKNLETTTHIFKRFNDQLTETITNVSKASATFDDLKALPREIYNNAMKASLRTAPMLLDRLGLRDKDGNATIRDRKGNIDPNKVFAMQSPFVRSIAEWQKSIDETAKAKQDVEKIESFDNAENNRLKDELERLEREKEVRQGFVDSYGDEDSIEKLRQTNADLDDFLNRLSSEQKEAIDYLKKDSDDQKEILESAKEALESKKAAESYNAGIAAMQSHEEANYHLLGDFEKQLGLAGLFQAGRQGQQMGMGFLGKSFQFGSNSLSSNISKGVGNVLTKMGPKILSGAGKVFGKALGPIVTILTTLAGLIKRGVDTWLEYEEKALEVTKTMGMGAHDAHGYQQDLMWMTHKYAAQYGLEKEALLNIQAASNEATGRNTVLNEEQLIDAVAGRKFMGDQTYAAMMKSFEMAGGSADSAMKYGMMTMERAAKMGLNMQKASAEFAKNMGMVNKYSFKSGVDGISKMTLLSQQLKFNLESMSSLFDKAATIEGSIDVAAHMQMLGGTYATQFGNPMRLLYNSLNNVEEMTQTVIDTVVSKGRFNEKTGTVDINNLDRAFIKEMSKIIGVSQEDLFNMASRKVFISEVSKHMATDLTEAQRGQLANMAQFSQTQGWIVSYLDANNELVTKQIDEIHAEDMDAINKGRMYDTVEDNVENIWLLLKEKYRDEAATATSLKAKKAGLDNAYDLALGGNRAVAGSMGGISHIADRWSSRHNDAFFYKDGTVHPLAPDDNVYAFKGAGQVDPGAGRFYNSSITNVRMAEQMTQSFIKGSTNTLASAVSNSMRSMNSSSNSSVRFRETENVYSSIESSVSKAVTNTLKAGAFNADVNVNGTINLKFPDGSSVDMIKQLQKPEVVRMLSSIIAQQLARLDNKGATPALGTNALKGTAI